LCIVDIVVDGSNSPRVALHLSHPFLSHTLFLSHTVEWEAEQENKDTKEKEKENKDKDIKRPRTENKRIKVDIKELGPVSCAVSVGDSDYSDTDLHTDLPGTTQTPPPTPTSLNPPPYLPHNPHPFPLYVLLNPVLYLFYAYMSICFN
jgi:hypothetical protein